MEEVKAMWWDMCTAAGRAPRMVFPEVQLETDTPIHSQNQTHQNSLRKYFSMATARIAFPHFSAFLLSHQTEQRHM